MAKKTTGGNKSGKSGQSTNRGSEKNSGKKSYQPTRDRTSKPPAKK